MKQLYKSIYWFLSIIITAIIVFYFWASSRNLDENSYSQLIQNQHPSSVRNDSIFCIVTYNIGYLSGMTNNRPIIRNKVMFENNMKSIKNVFSELDPDIICLQEVDYESNRSFYVNQQNELATLGYNHIFQAINWDKKYVPFPYYPISTHFGQVTSGQSILSKYPLENAERIVLEKVKIIPFYQHAFYIDRLAQVSKIKLGHKTAILINVHLEAFDAGTRRKQTNFIVGLYNKYKNDFPILLVGDFNSDIKYKNASINQLLEIPAIASAKFDVDNTHKTFPSSDPEVRLDYIFYNTDKIEMLDAEIVTAVGEASDHLPVMMSFKLR